jgi:hypothetical protein
VISAHVAAVAWYSALMLLGGLVGGLVWIPYTRQRTLEDIERYQAKRLRELNREQR